MTALSRFHEAQEGVFDRALSELRAGRKRSHWMWFVFPQLRGLGHSETSEFFGLDGLSEARAFLADPVLGDRLKHCAAAILRHEDKDARAILGSVDALKLRSCATLFSEAGGGQLFDQILDSFFDGRPCQRTMRMLESE